MGAPGSFIAIEGNADSGAQLRLLEGRLHKLGYEVASFRFPRFESEGGFFVREYLNGTYGPPDKLNPYACTLFYALDRFEAAAQIRAALDAGKIVLVNHFTGASMAEQGSRFQHPEERRGFFLWLDSMEYQILGIPRPSHSFILRDPTNVGSTNTPWLPAGTSQAYEDLSRLFPKDFETIDANKSDLVNVHNRLWTRLEQILPPRPSTQAAPEEPAAPQADSTQTNPYVQRRSDGTWSVTSAGEDLLAKMLTAPRAAISAITTEVSPAVTTALMARFARRSDDPRIIMLDEFPDSGVTDSQLFTHAIATYGEDSARSLKALIPQPFLLHSATQLAHATLARQQLDIVDQPLRHLRFGRRDEGKGYAFYTPDNLPPELQQTYAATITDIFDIHSELIRRLAEQTRAPQKARKQRNGRRAAPAAAYEAAAAVLPVAATSPLAVFTSATGLEDAVANLTADNLNEHVTIAKRMLEEARKLIPAFLEAAGKPDAAGGSSDYLAHTRRVMAEAAELKLSNAYSAETTAVQLVDFWPRNELELLNTMLFDHASIPLEQIRREVSNLRYEEKLELFKSYFGSRTDTRQLPGNVLRHPHYMFEIVTDFITLRTLQGQVRDLNIIWQPFSPRYGFEMSEPIEQSGLSDLFERCFDLSARLYSDMQAAGFEPEAQYATLLGHKLRVRIELDGVQLFRLLESNTRQQPTFHSLVGQLRDSLAEVHPLVTEAVLINTPAEAQPATAQPRTAPRNRTAKKTRK